MEWEVEFTDEFELWWKNLTEAEQEDVSAVVELLEAKGPQLPFPYSSGINRSKHSHNRLLAAFLTLQKVIIQMKLPDHY